MLSTLLELLGFAAFAVAAYLLAGAAGALIVAGAELLLFGYATEDDQAAIALRRPFVAVGNTARSIRGRLKQRHTAPGEG